MPLEYVLFDLDDTIYPRNTPIMPAIGEKIKTFLIETLKLTYEEATERRAYYNQVYGTVLRGLLQEETVDIQAYLEQIHDIPVQDYLSPNPRLQQILPAISLKKYIFTNSYRKHAENVLRVLDIEPFFDGIFDIRSVNYVSKPAKHPYTTIVGLLETRPQTCIYIDDQARNLREAKRMGMRTILVDAEPNQWVDITVKNAVDACRAIIRLIDETG